MLDIIQLINFSHPIFLFGIFVPVFILSSSYIYNNYSSNRYCDKALLAWVVVNNKKTATNKFFLGKALPFLTWVLFCIALSGPRINIDERALTDNKKYTNAVVFVVDISKSMLAEDVYPNRITQAKLAIESFIINSKDFLVSLVVYANNSHVVIPLTYDGSVILDVLSSIRPNLLPIEGSNYSAGLETAMKLLNTSEALNKSIFLFSDGDYDQKNKLNTLVKASVNVFGVGSYEGKPIPLKNGGWLTIDNQPIISRLNEVNLKAIANSHNGTYQKLSSSINQEEFNLHKYANKTLLETNSNKTIIIWKQIYYWFLVPATLLFLFSTVKLNNLIVATENNAAKLNNSILILISISLLVVTPKKSIASDLSIETANEYYNSKNYIKSENIYKKLEGFKALIGQANSLYKQKNYTKAIQVYIQSVLTARNNSDRSIAIFNLANTYYVIGDYTQSITLYKDVIYYNPNVNQAKINMGYAIAIEKRIRDEIELRKGNIKATQPGTGPRSANIEQGIDVGNSKVTLSDNDDSETNLYTLPLNDEVSKKLIERGIKHSNISSTKIENLNSNSLWNYDYTTIDMLELEVQQEKIDNYNLWKRLFEIEEGFPAPVETPHTKKGVNPW